MALLQSIKINPKLLISIALVVCLLVSLGVWVVTPEAYLAVLAINAICIAWSVSISIVFAQTSAQQKKMIQQAELLVNLSENQLDNDEFAHLFPDLEPDSPWYHRCQKLFHKIAHLIDEMSDAEQVRARSEVRAHLAGIRSDQLSDIINALSEPVLMINQFEELVITNESARTLFGLSEELETTNLDDVIQNEPLVHLMHETRRRKSASQRICEIEITDANNEKHWYQVTCSTVEQRSEGDSKSQNHCFGAVSVFRDISGYKAIQKRNAEFVSAVSHEMKTPLAGIKAYVELLSDGEAEDEETRDEFLSVINGQADRLQRLIDNLLNLARIEAGVVNVNKKPRSLNDVLEEAANLVSPTAEQKQITLVTDLSPMYLGVLVDRDMILQAAINLLSNSLKYTPEGGTVTLRSRLVDREVIFEVEDTGVGLSVEDCEMVFEKFYRVKKDQKMASGTGLGLPLAKHIVEDVHGGAIKVNSILNKGSTFRITLPTVQVTESVNS